MHLADLCITQRLAHQGQGNVQVGLPMEGAAQPQMLVMQAAQAEQLTGRHDYLTGQQLSLIHI